MGVMRTRPGSAAAAAKKPFFAPKDGTFAAHTEKSWTASSADAGAWYGIPAARPRPKSAAAKVLANPNNTGRLASESVGLHTGWT